ncbi:unnamed protein product [Miscanthus lutarioriparius]|uniref:MCAfunc domain-containing protein n=1 Tax=Miscanthus lutarioriparius TaxID=422564 RepID=A0A811Q4F2_9POAL|nr:unnamed protein product [Miscanthus lutarioriparius]
MDSAHYEAGGDPFVAAGRAQGVRGNATQPWFRKDGSRSKDQKLKTVQHAAQTVRHNKKTCQQLVHHVQIINDLLKKLQTPEMMEHPETRNGLNNLEEILREAYMFVTSCQNNNYVYHLFTGKKQADQFHILQNRMNSCLQVFPLISHIDTTDRLDKILEIIRPPCSQVVRDVPRLLAGCSSCDTRLECAII